MSFKCNLALTNMWDEVIKEWISRLISDPSGLFIEPGLMLNENFSSARVRGRSKHFLKCCVAALV